MNRLCKHTDSEVAKNKQRCNFYRFIIQIYRYKLKEIQSHTPSFSIIYSNHLLIQLDILNHHHHHYKFLPLAQGTSLKLLPS